MVSLSQIDRDPSAFQILSEDRIATNPLENLAKGCLEFNKKFNTNTFQISQFIFSLSQDELIDLCATQVAMETLACQNRIAYLDRISVASQKTVSYLKVLKDQLQDQYHFLSILSSQIPPPQPIPLFESDDKPSETPLTEEEMPFSEENVKPVTNLKTSLIERELLFLKCIHIAMEKFASWKRKEIVEQFGGISPFTTSYLQMLRARIDSECDSMEKASQLLAMTLSETEVASSSTGAIPFSEEAITLSTEALPVVADACNSIVLDTFKPRKRKKITMKNYLDILKKRENDPKFSLDATLIREIFLLRKRTRNKFAQQIVESIEQIWNDLRDFKVPVIKNEKLEELGNIGQNRYPLGSRQFYLVSIFETNNIQSFNIDSLNDKAGKITMKTLKEKLAKAQKALVMKTSSASKQKRKAEVDEEVNQREDQFQEPSRHKFQKTVGS